MMFDEMTLGRVMGPEDKLPKAFEMKLKSLLTNVLPRDLTNIVVQLMGSFVCDEHKCQNVPVDLVECRCCKRNFTLCWVHEEETASATCSERALCNDCQDSPECCTRCKRFGHCTHCDDCLFPICLRSGWYYTDTVDIVFKGRWHEKGDIPYPP